MCQLFFHEEFIYEVILCIKKRNGQMHARTGGRMDVPKSICLSNFFDVGVIIIMLIMIQHQLF